MIQRILAFLRQLFSRAEPPVPTYPETPVEFDPPPEPSPEPPLADRPLPPGYLTPHFTLLELTRSATADRLNIDNTPPPGHVENLKRLAETLEDVRALLGGPILVSSGYRSRELNKVVGGSSTSDHANGLAADFTCPSFGSVMKACQLIAGSDIKFDQLIYEQGNTEWIHLGIGPRQRRQVMSWAQGRGYVNGIVRLQ